MSKKIATLAFIFFISVNAFAQTEPEPKTEKESKGFRFGLQFSPQLCWLKNQDKLTNASGVKFGFNYGLIADFSLAQRYAFATGINISQNSGTIQHNDTVMFNSFNKDTFLIGTKVNYAKIQYIEIPLVLKLKTNEIGYLTYFGQFGFNLGVCTGVKGSISDPLNSTHNKVDENLGPDISPFNLSLNIGAGIEYSLSKSTAFVTSISFHNGFLDISDSPKNFKSKSILNQIELRLGILF